MKRHPRNDIENEAKLAVYEALEDFDQPPPTTWKDCRFCNGDGEVSALKLAAYKARGGPPPTEIEGYA